MVTKTAADLKVSTQSVLSFVFVDKGLTIRENRKEVMGCNFLFPNMHDLA